MKEADTGIIEAVKYAIQMEVDGKQFYALSVKESSGQVGKELFDWLAQQEDRHRQKFEEIYKFIAEKKGWPAVPINPGGNPRFSTIFGEALRAAGTTFKSQKGDLASADKAVEMEIKSRDYYADRAAKAVSVDEKKFFSAISAEEQGHYLALIDYKEYLTDPTGFFTRTEHHSLDGQ
jgi:rubrerythrin